MDVPILDEDPNGISNTLCINCGNCIDACPDAMSFGFRI
jgi:polyferredoxin